MTAYTGANLRSSGGYWELSGPAPLNQTATCRACRVSMPRGESVMCRDGRKLRFFYHVRCFTGGADPRSQEHSTYEEREDYHRPTAPKLSALEGPRAHRDPDGRVLSRTVFKPSAPRCVRGHSAAGARVTGRPHQRCRAREVERWCARLPALCRWRPIARMGGASVRGCRARSSFAARGRQRGGRGRGRAGRIASGCEHAESRNEEVRTHAWRRAPRAHESHVLLRDAHGADPLLRQARTTSAATTAAKVPRHGRHRAVENGIGKLQSERERGAGHAHAAPHLARHSAAFPDAQHQVVIGPEHGRRIRRRSAVRRRRRGHQAQSHEERNTRRIRVRDDDGAARPGAGSASMGRLDTRAQPRAPQADAAAQNGRPAAAHQPTGAGGRQLRRRDGRERRCGGGVRTPDGRREERRQVGKSRYWRVVPR